MNEVIVEGLDYEDFVALRDILSNNTNFSAQERTLYDNNHILIGKIEKILEVFEE